MVASYVGGPYGDVAVSADMLIAAGGSGTMTLGLRLGNWSGGGIPNQGYLVDLNSSGVVTLVRAGDWMSLGTYNLSGYATGTSVNLTLRERRHPNHGCRRHLCHW